MQRAYWSGEFDEAHVVGALLRAHGIHTWVFDASLVRQDWFYTLAFGGYRIMVSDSQVSSAHDLLLSYRAGALSLPEEEIDAPTCPHCAGNSADDPRPRRIAFGVLIGLQAAPVAFFASPALWWLTALAPLLPLLTVPLLGSWHRCKKCDKTFLVRKHRFAALARLVDDAEARAPRELG